MTGAFGSPTVDVTASIEAATIPAGERTFWLRGQDEGGTWGPAQSQAFLVNGDRTVDAEDRLPQRTALLQNAPNPFNPTTSIRYDLPRAGRVDLVIYNVRGERVRRLVSAHQEAGYKTAAWDGRNDGGQPVTSGIYFYRLETNDFEATRKMVMLK